MKKNISRRNFLKTSALAAGAATTAPLWQSRLLAQSEGRYASLIAAAAANLPAIPAGPFQPTWDSIRANYRDPEWFRDAKFGIMMHWGIYSVPAHGSEWYERYMYGGNAGIMKWHTDHYGPPTKFGYKDFLPMYTAAKWEPDAWAELFKNAGAKYVYASGEHHDGFSNWASDIYKFNAKNYGPKRDIVGDLLAAVRKQGLKTGVANHSSIHFDWVPALAGSDQYDPDWIQFYSVAERGSDAARQKFFELWVRKNYELIDKYQIDMLWLDINGNDRSWDPLKTQLCAYYYNRAAAWGKQTAICAKGEAFLAGMVMDFERQGRAPKQITEYIWQPDDPITDKFCYVEVEDPNNPGHLTGLKPQSAAGIVQKIVMNVSRNGNLLLNISPKADGTIPDSQQEVLKAVGKWLGANGDSIYGTRPWKISEEGKVHFTAKPDILYATSLNWPDGDLVIPSLGQGKAPEGKIEKIELLGHDGALAFTQDADGLKVKFPDEKPNDFAYALKITGLKIQPVIAMSQPALPKTSGPMGEVIPQ